MSIFVCNALEIIRAIASRYVLPYGTTRAHYCVAALERLT